MNKVVNVGTTYAMAYPANRHIAYEISYVGDFVKSKYILFKPKHRTKKKKTKNKRAMKSKGNHCLML